MMEIFGDDILALIFAKIEAPDDRKSLALVCKQWLKVESAKRSSLHVSDPHRLPDILPRFPNLLRFRATSEIPNSAIKYVVDTCARIQFIDFNYHKVDEKGRMYENTGLDDLDDEGLRCIAKGLPDLETVLLRKRAGITSAGVASFGEFSKKLRVLDLGWCRRVCDDALESISELRNLEVLNLQGCDMITDAGLEWLGEGYICNTLTSLNLAGCARITDRGVMNLSHIVALEELDLSNCGSLTDIGIDMGVVSGLIALKKLNLSWLVRVSDKTLLALTRCCWLLEVLDLTGCESVTLAGFRALSGYMSLRELYFTRCYWDVTGEDLEEVVFWCSTLEYIVLDGRLRSSIPEAIRDKVSKNAWWSGKASEIVGVFVGLFGPSFAVS